MLFNSLDFAVFLPIVFGMYWFLTKNNRDKQNLLIVLSSYVFYGWWDWRFVSLIVISTVADYFIGLNLYGTPGKQRKQRLLWLSIVINLGLLGVFKYYNFFAENFASAFRLFGQDINTQSLNIILPVGISFYTFQTLSYTIDIYRQKLKPCGNFIEFAGFVSFFPQLVAGPIERASNLLPQFQTDRQFDFYKSSDGMRQILWGLFKKVVIADNCAVFANEVFSQSDASNGSTLALGVLFFTFQIYGDFSGYSDIAIGTARLFGFNLRQNFAFPYFSRDIAEFWRRWHISLSSWFRDYLYIPLGGSRVGTLKKIRNTFIIFLVSGFWHGANWTFICWGLLHAVYFLPLLLTNRNRNNLEIKNQLLPSFKEFLQTLLTFVLVAFAWIFFRAETMSQAVEIISQIFSKSLFETPVLRQTNTALLSGLLVLIFIGVEWLGKSGHYGIERLGQIRSKPVCYALYLLLALSIFVFGNFDKTEFIYFAF